MSAPLPDLELVADSPGANSIVIKFAEPVPVELPGEGPAPLAIALSFVNPVDIPLQMPAIYRGMRGLPGDPGDKGDPGDVPELPDLTLIFENQLA